MNCLTYFASLKQIIAVVWLRSKTDVSKILETVISLSLLIMNECMTPFLICYHLQRGSTNSNLCKSKNKLLKLNEKTTVFGIIRFMNLISTKYATINHLYFILFNTWVKHSWIFSGSFKNWQNIQISRFIILMDEYILQNM